MIRRTATTLCALLLTVVLTVGLVLPGVAASEMESPDTLSVDKVDVLIGFHGPPDAGLVRGFDGHVRRQFCIVDVISAYLPAHVVEALERTPAVRYIEPNYPVYATGQAVPWGIDRVFGDESYSFSTWVSSTGQV